MSKRVGRGKTEVECIDLCGSLQKTAPIQVRKPRKLKRSSFTQGNLFDPDIYVTRGSQS